MYNLSRGFLRLAALGFIYSLLVLIPVALPWSGLVVVAILLLLFRRAKQHLTTLGSARWADENDLRRAGMLNAQSGLIIGRIPARRDFASRMRTLFDWNIRAEDVCRELLLGGTNATAHLVRLPNAIHTAVFSPSGGGKGVSCVIPFLLTCKESCVVVDFKGENAKLTAQHRKKYFGHKIVLLDPFRVVTQQPDAFNPLDFIDKGNPLALDECGDLANALVVRTGEERDPHWNDSSEFWIKAMLATVVQYGETDTRSLQTIREILSHPEKLEMAVKLMNESDSWKGMLARMGGQLLHYVEKERSSTLTTVSRHLKFLDTLAIADSTKGSTFNPAGLLTGKMTIYLVLPPEHMRAQSPLLRMWIGSFFRAVVRGGLQEKNKTHFILDEAASLGAMEAIDDAVDKLRGYGARLQFYFQGMGQLKRCFPNGQDQTLLSNTTQVFFGVNDPTTADYISTRLGEKTIIVESGGSGKGSSREWGSGQNGQGTGSYSDNSNTNWEQQARKLLNPDEVAALPPRSAITFTPGVPPVFSTLLRYYEEKKLGRQGGWLSRVCAAFRTFAMALVILLGTAAMAATLTEMVFGIAHSPPAASPYQYRPQRMNQGGRTVRPAKSRF